MTIGQAVNVMGRTVVVVATVCYANAVRAETPSTLPDDAAIAAQRAEPAEPSAEPRAEPSPAVITAPTVAPSQPARDERSPGLALALSGMPTLAGAGLAIAGLVVANRPQECSGDPSVPPGVTCIDHFPLGLRLTVIGGALLAIGPSLGHLYNGRVWTTGLKIRVAAVGVAALGLAITLVPASCDGFVCGPQAIGLLVVMGGGATFGVGAFHDAATVHAATRERNQLQLSFAPLRTPRGTAPGLVLHTAF